MSELKNKKMRTLSKYELVFENFMHIRLLCQIQEYIQLYANWFKNKKMRLFNKYEQQLFKNKNLRI